MTRYVDLDFEHLKQKYEPDFKRIANAIRRYDNNFPHTPDVGYVRDFFSSMKRISTGHTYPLFSGGEQIGRRPPSRLLRLFERAKEDIKQDLEDWAAVDHSLKNARRFPTLSKFARKLLGRDETISSYAAVIVSTERIEKAWEVEFVPVIQRLRSRHEAQQQALQMERQAAEKEARRSLQSRVDAAIALARKREGPRFS